MPVNYRLPLAAIIRSRLDHSPGSPSPSANVMRGWGVCMDEAIQIAGRGTAGYAVTFDVDALDPGDAPGSGTLVRGGLSYREAHLAMEKIAEDGRMRSLEVVEINTALDVNNRTAELGVELILSALGKTIL